MGSLQNLPRRVFDGFGYSSRGLSVFAEPTNIEALAELFRRAHQEGVKIAFRGNGRSYGDAAMNTGGLVLDLRKMRRILRWDPENGIFEAEPGARIQDLWQKVLPDGWWPKVVPGTMFPTLGGCLAMNIHGKNHAQLGGIGDAVLDFDLLTPAGESFTCSREQHPELFFAAIGGFGLLGAITRVRLSTKKVHSGRLRVQQFPARNLAEQFELFERFENRSDYLVGWLDCIVGGEGLGRGQIHVAHYFKEGEDPEGAQMMTPERQVLPGSIMGVPKGLVGQILKVFQSNLGMGTLNTAKYFASLLGSTAEYRQGHVAFHFLLDYVPAFRDAYRPHGFIQFQPFVPKESAQRVFGEILRMNQAADLVSYLGVLKRYRPDNFLLSHALDGYSLALDYPITATNRDALWAHCAALAELVISAGGRFYPAKDATLSPEHYARTWGPRLEQFRALRSRCDPHRVLSTNLARRVGVDSQFS